MINSFEFRVYVCVLGGGGGGGGVKGVSNEKLEPCSKSSGVTLLEMTQLLVGNTAFSIMEVTWRKGFALLPDRNFHPFRWKRENHPLGQDLSLSRSSRQLNNRFCIVASPPFISFEYSRKTKMRRL